MTATLTDTDYLPAGLDREARYRCDRWPGIAFYVSGPVIEETYEGDYLVCDDEDCDHQLSEMCWTEGDTSLSLSAEQVKVIMVGDDTEHIVDVDELHPLDEEEFCGCCGQIGCSWD